jgi:hypothetical protein
MISESRALLYAVTSVPSSIQHLEIMRRQLQDEGEAALMLYDLLETPSPPYRQYHLWFTQMAMRAWHGQVFTTTGELFDIS